MKCWTRPNHLRTLVQPGTRPGLFWFLAWARSAVHVCTSISITKVWERAKNKRVRNWSLSKAVGKATLVEKQLGQLWWKEHCGLGGHVLLGSGRSCSPPSVQPELHVWGSGMVPGSSARCSPWPLLNLFVGKQWRRQNEMLLESVWVCKNLYLCVHTCD